MIAKMAKHTIPTIPIIADYMLKFGWWAILCHVPGLRRKE